MGRIVSAEYLTQKNGVEIILKVILKARVNAKDLNPWNQRKHCIEKSQRGYHEMAFE
jgi:hypothetical protein